MTLNHIPLYQEVIIQSLHHDVPMKRRLMDLGFIKGNCIIPIMKSPSNGMRVYLVKGGKIAIRIDDEKKIEVL